MKIVNYLADPFRYCEENCNHDLARGVSVRDLLARDGPHPAMQHVFGVGAIRAVLLPGTGVPDAA